MDLMPERDVEKAWFKLDIQSLYASLSNGTIFELDMEEIGGRDLYASLSHHIEESLKAMDLEYDKGDQLEARLALVRTPGKFTVTLHGDNVNPADQYVVTLSTSRGTMQIPIPRHSRQVTVKLDTPETIVVTSTPVVWVYRDGVFCVRPMVESTDSPDQFHIKPTLLMGGTKYLLSLFTSRPTENKTLLLNSFFWHLSPFVLSSDRARSIFGGSPAIRAEAQHNYRVLHDIVHMIFSAVFVPKVMRQYGEIQAQQPGAQQAAEEKHRRVGKEDIDSGRNEEGGNDDEEAEEHVQPPARKKKKQPAKKRKSRVAEIVYPAFNSGTKRRRGSPQDEK